MRLGAHSLHIGAQSLGLGNCEGLRLTLALGLGLLWESRECPPGRAPLWTQGTRTKLSSWSAKK